LTIALCCNKKLGQFRMFNQPSTGVVYPVSSQS
jgi:hypothetical protein